MPGVAVVLWSLAIIAWDGSLTGTAGRIGEPPTVGAKITVLDADGKYTEKIQLVQLRELAGDYHRGDGLACNFELTLHADRTFNCSSSGCFGVQGTASGDWSLDGSGVALATRRSEGLLKDKVTSRLYIVLLRKYYLLVEKRPELTPERRFWASAAWCFRKDDARKDLQDEWSRVVEEVIQILEKEKPARGKR
jgi:hypothetical protein